MNIAYKNMSVCKLLELKATKEREIEEIDTVLESNKSLEMRTNRDIFGRKRSVKSDDNNKIERDAAGRRINQKKV